MMKSLFVALVMLATLPAHALTLTAKLDSFQSTDANLNNTGAAGGIGTFSLLSDVTGTEVDWLGATFLAMCLEPDELVAQGKTYEFEVVGLADAPTSTGGMGSSNAAWVDAIFTGLGFDSIDDVAGAGAVALSAVQMAVYEAGYETSGVFDWSSGSAALTGAGGSLTAQLTTYVSTPQLSDLEFVGLLNRAVIPSSGSRVAYTGQDFMVVHPFDVGETPSVQAPGSLALFGLGLLGVGLRYRGGKNE